MHAGTPLTAASLALAERAGIGGEDVPRAMVLGYEAAGRISAAITPGFRGRGFHGCLRAIFAATVASGVLLRLDAERLAQAIALSATSIGGLATAADTLLAREYHAGLAVLQGVTGALAAQRGYRGELGILEGRRGLFEAFGDADGAAAGSAALEGLGESWDIVTDMAVKLMPGGHPYHAIAEAAANARCDGSVAAGEIERIASSRPGMTALSGPLHPANLIDRAHSPAYFAAAGASDHAFGWEHLSTAKITDPLIHRLIDLVRVGDPPAADAARYRQGATVTIRTRDGRRSTSTVYVPKGAGMLGIAWSDVDAKYRALGPSGGQAPDAIEDSLSLIHDFRQVANVSRLTALLC